MSDTPEKIWATEFSHGDKSWTDNPRIGKYRKEREYIRKDVSDAEKEAAVAAEREACAMVANAAKTRNTVYEKARRDAAEAIRAQTPTDARAVLDARDKRVREAALREAQQAVHDSEDRSEAIGAIEALIDRTAERKDT